MPLTQAELATAALDIEHTVFDSAVWDRALGWLAKAAGGQFGQVLGAHPVFGFQFNFVSEIPPEFAREFERWGGNDPRINPRARVLARPNYSIHVDRTLATEEELAKNEFLHELAYRIGSADICVSRLPAINGVLLCAAVSRTRKQKPFEEQERKQFSALLPHIYNAIKMRSVLDQQGAALAAGALDAASCAACIVDSTQKIVAMTGEAEIALRKMKFARVQHQKIEPVDSAANASFQKALGLACAKPGSVQQLRTTTLFLRSEDGQMCEVDISPLPATEFSLRFGPVAVITFERAKGRSNAGGQLQDRFELTQAETYIVLEMLRGIPVGQIAQDREASPETVRTQIKSIRHKVGVGSRAELMRKLALYVPPASQS